MSEYSTLGGNALKSACTVAACALLASGHAGAAQTLSTNAVGTVDIVVAGQHFTQGNPPTNNVLATNAFFPYGSYGIVPIDSRVLTQNNFYTPNLTLYGEIGSVLGPSIGVGTTPFVRTEMSSGPSLALTNGPFGGLNDIHGAANLTYSVELVYSGSTPLDATLKVPVFYTGKLKTDITRPADPPQGPTITANASVKIEWGSEPLSDGSFADRVNTYTCQSIADNNMPVAGSCTAKAFAGTGVDEDGLPIAVYDEKKVGTGEMTFDGMLLVPVAGVSSPSGIGPAAVDEFKVSLSSYVGQNSTTLQELTGSAYADPTFYIDPSFAAAHPGFNLIVGLAAPPRSGAR